MARKPRTEPGWKKPASAGKPGRLVDDEDRPPPPRRRRRIWPYVIVMLIAWGAIFVRRFLVAFPVRPAAMCATS